MGDQHQLCPRHFQRARKSSNSPYFFSSWADISMKMYGLVHLRRTNRRSKVRSRSRRRRCSSLGCHRKDYRARTTRPALMSPSLVSRPLRLRIPMDSLEDTLGRAESGTTICSSAAVVALVRRRGEGFETSSSAFWISQRPVCYTGRT